MDETSIVLMALPPVSLALAFWVLLPRLLVVLGKTDVQRGFCGGPEEGATYWLHNIDADLVEQLTALGFRPVGMYWEQKRLGRRFLELVFVSEAQKCFAMLYPNDQIMPRRATFLTVSEQGWVVFTKNYHGGVELREETFVAGAPAGPPTTVYREREPRAADQPRTTNAWPLAIIGSLAGLAATVLVFHSFDESALIVLAVLGLGALAMAALPLRFGSRKPGQDPAAPNLDVRFPLNEVLAVHRARLQPFLQAGSVPIIGSDPEKFLDVQQRYHAHPHLQATYRAAELTNLMTRAFFLALIPGLLAWRLGGTHPAPWACLLVESLIGLAMRYRLSSGQVIHLLRTVAGDKPQSQDGPRA